MKNCARAIIIKDDQFIFMKRTKIVDGVKKIYYTTIGGHVEDGESFEETCIREVEEEANVIVKINKLFYEEYNKDLDKYEKYYNVNIISGELKKGNGPEFSRNDKKYGEYELVKIAKKDLLNYNIVPLTIKELLIEKYVK